MFVITSEFYGPHRSSSTQPRYVLNALILVLGYNCTQGDAEDLVGIKFTNVIKVQCRQTTLDRLPRANMAKGSTTTSTADRYCNTPLNYQLFSGADYNSALTFPTHSWRPVWTSPHCCLRAATQEKDESWVCLSSAMEEEKGQRDAIESTVRSWREDDSVSLLTASGSRWNSDPVG